MQLTRRPAWLALQQHAGLMRARHLRDLFAVDEARGQRFVAEAAGFYFDYAKQRVDDSTIELLLALAEACGVRHKARAMFRGELVNHTEHRAALHTALRGDTDEPVYCEGVDVMPGIQAVHQHMASLAVLVRSGEWRGYTGRRIRHVINIGIGGSDLGVAMACTALKHYSQRDLDIRFISNVDGTAFTEAVLDLDPAETLFVVCSKTFTTEETLANARWARAWCLQALVDETALTRHFVAVSSDAARAVTFGIAAENVFAVPDWVGGRYSLCSAMGLTLMIAIGPGQFFDMLGGFRAVDLHFLDAPAEQNIPLLMGMLAVWNHNFLGAATAAVLPYEQYLHRLPAYLQQLVMESCGKHVTQHGVPTDYTTGAVIWGEAGTNGQHSFCQLLHQGTEAVPCDFIGFCEPLNPSASQHDALIANLFAQAEALAMGETRPGRHIPGAPSTLDAHRAVDGNRPSSILLGQRLTPRSLGALIALYEHSVFTQAAIWDVDAFDQWGVELGKSLAHQALEDMTGHVSNTARHDSSTQALIARYRRLRVGPVDHAFPERAA